MQVKKTKELEPLPSFSFGLTQMEEEERNDTTSSSDGGKNKEQKTRKSKGKEKKHKKKKQQNVAQDSDEGSSDDENYGKNGKAAKTMDLRIGICSSILSDSSNCKRNYVEKAATSYYEELIQKLAR